MLEIGAVHNQFREDLAAFTARDPHLTQLAKLPYQHSSDWWKVLEPRLPGIYILTGGRQVDKIPLPLSKVFRPIAH